MQKEQSFLAYAYAEIARMKMAGHSGLADNCRCACNSLRRYWAIRYGAEPSFAMLTGERMVHYQDWLWAHGVSRNSSSCYLRSLQSLYNKAAGLGLTSGTPFAAVYTGVDKTRKRAIREEEVKRMYSAHIATELVRKGKNPAGKPFARIVQQLEFARDLFLFCFSARGMAFVDLAYLRPSDVCKGYIRYSRRKTRQAIVVKVEPMMQAVIHKYAVSGGPYLFPFLCATRPQDAYMQYRKALRWYNGWLRQLSLLLDIEVPLSSYVSRHTWATVAYHRQMPVAIISQAMGHNSEHTTRIYLKSLDESRIDDANQQMLNLLFGE